MKFTRNDTKSIKGFGILFMLIHHLWNLSDRYPMNEAYMLTGPFPNLTLNGPAWYTVLGRFGKICVPIFAFLAGYGLYMQYSAGKLSVFGKIKKLYLQYWKVFIIFIPVAFIFFRDQETINLFSQNYRSFHINEFIVNFLAIDTELYNGEWWFVMGFSISCVLGYLYVHLTENRKLHEEIILIFLINFFMYRALPMFIYTDPFRTIRKGFIYQMYLKQVGMTAFFTGILCAKYQLLDRGKQWIMALSPVKRAILFLFGTVAFICIRTFNGFEVWDFVLIPFYILICLGFSSISPGLTRIFAFLGEHSMNIWLVHSFYCYYFTPFVKIVYGSQNALISLLITLGLSLATSMLLNGFYRLCGTVTGKLHRKSA